MAKIAIVDLMFSWPPHGGGCIDVKETATGLTKLGHDIHLFAAHCPWAWQRGALEQSLLDFPVHKIEFTYATFTRFSLPRRFRREVDALSPDIVFFGDSYFLKPFLIHAFADYPVVARFYTYEVFCPRYYMLYRDGHTCDTHYLQSPLHCMRCAMEEMRNPILRWRHDVWSHEFIASLAFLPGYHKRVLSAVQRCDAIVVYNTMTRDLFLPYNSSVYVVPGGVDPERFPYTEPPRRSSHDTKYILMTGRIGDERKGIRVVHRAAEILRKERNDFKVWITHDDVTANNGVIEAVGWHSHDKLAQLYSRADICVVPSLWAEPFGMVAVEAMASGRPVVASKIGGLADSVVDGETGYLVPPGDAAALADKLRVLLDDPQLRAEMGRRGRARVEESFSWPRIVQKHYPPILNGVMTRSGKNNGVAHGTGSM
jgi:glycosyltransferase involved in cell wall biosynthesis